MDEPFDPTPWLRFPEVILLGAERYYHQLPPGGSFCCWDKLAGTTPADFAAGELIWLSKPRPLQVFPHLWRGGMRAGEENVSRLQEKLHPAQKPVRVMRRCVQMITPGRVIIDPFMGSGTTLVACVRLGRPCIGIEKEPAYFATACARVEEELQQLGPTEL
jgi:site-specific DNA-methyltransferase (adenine-specific)/modification methylase